MNGDEPDYGDIASKIGDLAEVTDRISDLCEKHDISRPYSWDWDGNLTNIGEALEKSVETAQELNEVLGWLDGRIEENDGDKDGDWEDKTIALGIIMDAKDKRFASNVLDVEAVYKKKLEKLKADHVCEVNEMMHDPKWQDTEVKRLREKEAEYLTIVKMLSSKILELEKKPQKRKREEEEKESAPPEKKQKKEEEATPPQKMMTSCDEENLEEHEKMHDKLDELIQKYTNKDVASEFENGWYAWEEKMAAIANQFKLFDALKAQAARANDYGKCPCERSRLVPLLVTATCHKCKTEYTFCCDNTIEIRRHKYCDTKECRPVFDCDRCGDTGITHDGIGAACQAIDRACTSCSYEGCNADDCSKDDMCDKCKALKCTRCQDVGSLRGQFNIDMGPCGDCDPDGAEEFMAKRLKPGKF
jgi:hypothetical protein